MTPRRILMTTDAVGGVWNYSLHLAKALAGYGVRFDLATMGPLPSESQKQEAAALANVALYESTYQLEWTQDPWDDITRAGEWLLELAQRLRPDIVHLNGYSHAALPWTAPACVVAHSCVLSWWEAVHGETAPDSWARYGAAVAEGIRKADHVIAPTAAMLKALRKNYGALPRSSVIHNGNFNENCQSGTKAAHCLRSRPDVGRSQKHRYDRTLCGRIAVAIRHRRRRQVRIHNNEKRVAAWPSLLKKDCTVHEDSIDLLSPGALRTFRPVCARSCALRLCTGAG